MLGAIETVIGVGPGTTVRAALLALLESVVLTTATTIAVFEVTACGAV
jgi:hypothetical protein